MNQLKSRFQNKDTKPYTMSNCQIIYYWIDKNLLETFKITMRKLKTNNAGKVFNKLSLSIREKSNYKIFCSMTKFFFNDKGLTRIMYLWIIVMYQLHITLIFSFCPFEVVLPYKCLWYIMWITILPDSDNCFSLSLMTT